MGGERCPMCSGIERKVAGGGTVKTRKSLPSPDGMYVQCTNAWHDAPKPVCDGDKHGDCVAAENEPAPADGFEEVLDRIGESLNKYEARLLRAAHVCEVAAALKAGREEGFEAGALVAQDSVPVKSWLAAAAKRGRAEAWREAAKYAIEHLDHPYDEQFAEEFERRAAREEGE